MRGSRSLHRITVIALAALGSPLWGQSSQYIAPGTLGRSPVDAREALRSAVDDARWRLGPLRLDPWIGLRDVAWIDEASGPGSDGDLTVSAGAGLRAYLPRGSRLVLAAHVLPEYVWWRDRPDGDRVAGRHGVGLFLYGNRLGVEIRATSRDQNTYPSSDLDRIAQVRVRELAADVEIPLGHRISLFARGSSAETRVRDEAGDADTAFSALDRDEETAEAGLRLRIGRALWLGLGAGSSRTDFDDRFRDLSNDGSSVIAELELRGNRLDGKLTYRQLDLEPRDGSEFRGFDGDSGEARITWKPRSAWELSAYGLRQLTYSAVGPEGFFLDERLGAALALPVGHRVRLHVFHEEGENRYGGDGAAGDVTSSGGGFDLDLLRSRARLSGSFRETRRTGAGLDRGVSELRVGLDFGRARGLWY